MSHVIYVTGQVMLIMWTCGLLIPVCMYLGYRTAKRTGRSVVNWLLMGFLIAVFPPPVSIAISIVAYYWYPPAMPKRTLAPRPDDEKPASGRSRHRPPRTGSRG